MTKPTADQIIQAHRAQQKEVLARIGQRSEQIAKLEEEQKADRIRWKEQAAIIATAEALTPKEAVSDED